MNHGEVAEHDQEDDAKPAGQESQRQAGQQEDRQRAEHQNSEPFDADFQAHDLGFHYKEDAKVLYQLGKTLQDDTEGSR